MGEEIWAEIEYSSDLFDDTSIERMFAHYEKLLESIVADPEEAIGKLGILADAERAKLLVEWNDTRAEFPQDRCIHELFEQQVARNPEAVALDFEGRKLSYRDLNARANQLAHYLRGLDVGPDTLVGVLMARSADLVVAVLGVLKAGGAYVPMDPDYPKERLRCILDDSKASIVLSEAPLASMLPSFEGRLIRLEKDWRRIAGEPKENPVAPVKSEHLAYVLYTSGSTGRPKGVAVDHRPAVNFLQWARQVFTAQETAGVLFSTSICFDMSVFEMFVPLSVGGKIILAPNVLRLPDLPEKGEVTLLNTVPSAMAELLNGRLSPASLRTVNLAGEALSEALVEKIYTLTHAEKVYNHYGPTETFYSTYALVQRGCPVTIGKPIANTQCYILDASRNPVPIGVRGELYIAGSGLARDYCGRPELTNERFVPNPFNQQSGARMYRTGDICRWWPDGNMQYLGRVDRQVKLRGFRIELEEIERALRSHAKVREAAVLVREERERQLVAYVVPAGSPACATGELRDYLRQKLPDYMVPAAWVVLPELPLTPNGKLDRRALPAPDRASGHQPQGFVAPRSELEEKLACWWADVLGLERVSIHDNIFDLGGHSLTATWLVSRIRTGLCIDVPLRTLFERPTVAQFSEYLKAIEWVAGEPRSLARAANSDCVEVKP